MNRKGLKTRKITKSTTGTKSENKKVKKDTSEELQFTAASLSPKSKRSH